MNNLKLMPCPHCGQEDCCASAEDHGTPTQEKWWGNIFCRDCNMDGPDIGPEDTYEAWFEKAVEVWNTLPRHLQWTTKTPTEIGWYWYQASDWNTDVAVMAFVLENIVFIHNPGLEYVQHSRDNIKGRWAGPIPRPKDKNLCYDDRQRDIVTTD